MLEIVLLKINMGWGKKEKKSKWNWVEILWYEVWWKKWIQMVLNKLAKERLDHETIIDTLTKLLDIKKWDDTNFITFESVILSYVQHVRSNETKLSYQLLWRKFIQMRKTSKIQKTTSLFWDQVLALLEQKPIYWSGSAAWLNGVWALSVK